ncbi:MAG: hypothetical protein HYW89_03065 [Candidatus Sungiibacteriota bacterium]|uniref:Uncharacterized protein n=1 Tax=Candidatus Sungiibacteriota bacterium TaxID=2750080 RepID=A0A7T5RIW1_9BACT|nr:MAG: hypothetical protein HYW89_03065 [Candidatus Sungbacteria bacterium]
MGLDTKCPVHGNMHSGFACDQASSTEELKLFYVCADFPSPFRVYDTISVGCKVLAKDQAEARELVTGSRQYQILMERYGIVGLKTKEMPKFNRPHIVEWDSTLDLLLGH